MVATVPPAVTTPKLTADDVELQLAEATPRAFTRDGWGFELKYDGFRVLVERIDGVVRLLLRKGSEATKQFPEVVEAFAAVPGGDFIVDGELVIQDAVGRPIFQKLLQRGRLSSAREIDARMRADPAVYFAFDLLMDDGVDLRARPLRERKARLFERVKKGDRVLPVEHIEREGEALRRAQIGLRALGELRQRQLAMAGVERRQEAERLLDRAHEERRFPLLRGFRRRILLLSRQCSSPFVQGRLTQNQYGEILLQ